jgi:TolB-like protein
MSHAALLFLLAASEPVAVPAVAVRDGVIDGVSDGVSDGVEQVMARQDVVRVALPPVVDDVGAGPEAMAHVEKALVRALLDRGQDVVTPALLRIKLKAQGEAAIRDVGAEAMRDFAADHVLLAAVASEEGKTVLRLRLVVSETGAVRATSSTPLTLSGALSGAAAPRNDARGVRVAVQAIVDDIAWAVEATGESVRVHRTAVAPLGADEDARAARLDRYVESELVRALSRRGFLVVERADLDAALAQQALGQVLDEQNAPQVGQALGAQSLVLGTLAATGTVFTMNVRVVSASTGAVLGAGSASLPRDAVVALADVETRTPFEAAVRSAIAPGWGQVYNRQGEKAVVFAVGGYSALLATAGLGIGGALTHARYGDPAAFDELPPAERSRAATETKALGDSLYLSAIVAGAVTASVWSLGIVDAILDSPGSASASGGGAE